MTRKQPSRAIEIASESDEMNEENTTNSNLQNIKEEITGDEEHTSAQQESTIVIESTGQSEVPEPAEPPRRGSRNRRKTDFFGHNIKVTQVAQSPNAEARKNKN